jgi:hypothetical protein
MSKIKVYQFALFDINSGEMKKSKRLGTIEAIISIDGVIVDDSGVDIDEDIIRCPNTDLEGFTLIDNKKNIGNEIVDNINSVGLRKTPTVFISHAGEDKDRFVIEFAKKLRQSGVDAWFDKWEMLPGDSIVDKIFNDGLKNASAVIIIVSNNSINKPWVNAELNAAVVKRINGECKIIPIIIDDCNVPEVLRSTLWLTVSDLDEYEDVLQRVIAAVNGVSDKPPLGKPPSYINKLNTRIHGLSEIDSQVMVLACEHAIKNNTNYIDPYVVFFDGEKPVIPEEELRDSLGVLEHEYYIEFSRLLGNRINNFFITTHGFGQYAQEYMPDYDGAIRNVIAVLVNNKHRNTLSIFNELGLPKYIINHILDVLESNGHIKQSKLGGGSDGLIHEVYNVVPTLKRIIA